MVKRYIGMTKQPASMKKGLIIPVLLGFCAFFCACDSPASAARIITEKAKEQTRKMTLGKVITVADCLQDAEDITVEPGFSDHMAEKTELISSW
jgi:hypothetical protein